MLRKILLLSLLATPAMAQDDGPGPNLVIEVAGGANGTIVIDLLPDVAPLHVAQITTLASQGAYDNVVFHRVIDGFMAQTGDVRFRSSAASSAWPARKTRIPPTASSSSCSHRVSFWMANTPSSET
jgi:peptidylprolyl isomerase